MPWNDCSALAPAFGHGLLKLLRRLGPEFGSVLRHTVTFFRLSDLRP